MVDGLLTMLTRRMAGALDFGLVLLMEPEPEKFARFVNDHVAAPMRAASLVLRLAVAECVPEPAITPFQAVVVDTEMFLGALEELAGFPSLAEADLEAVTSRLATAHQRLIDSFLDIAERMCFEPTIAREFGPERMASMRLAIESLPMALAVGCDGSPGRRSVPDDRPSPVAPKRSEGIL
jgi:hypothetical protein